MSSILPPDAPNGSKRPKRAPEATALPLEFQATPTSRFGRLFRLAFFVGGVSAAVALLVGSLGFVHYSKDLPVFTSLDDYKPELSTRLYSVDGRLIGEFGTKRRVLVPYEHIPKRLIQAFVATEDRNFFDHGGIHFLGIVRAIVFKVIGKTSKIGGTSTLTQQLAKSLLVLHYQTTMGQKAGFAKGTERSISRKVKEMILARRIERSFNKEELLWLYLNQTFLGHGAYGVQAASEHYFRKDVEQLTLPEMALLAGLPQAPSRYSPLKSPKAAAQRVRTVLHRMEENGFITKEERDEATEVDLKSIVRPRDDAFGDTAPYFAEHVRRYIYDTYGQKALYQGGLKIYTTLDLERQTHAENAMVSGLRATDKRQGWRGPVAHMVGAADQEKAIEIIVKENAAATKEFAERMPSYPMMALVEKVNKKHDYVEIRVGEEQGILPLAGMRWARAPNPNEWWEYHLLKDVSKALKVGDVILVVKKTLKEMRGMARDKQGIQSIPKKPKGASIPTDVNVALPVWARPLYALDQVPRVEGALIAMNPHTGYVEAMIGGYAFEKSEFNRAFQSCRQPGSVFKPIVYSAAVVRESYTPATMVPDTPITVRDTDIGKAWKPQNFEMEFLGEVTARQALMNSMNVPALKTMQKVGVKNVVDFAYRMGIKTKLKEELGTAIGSSCVSLWELTHVYTTWARMGLRPEPVFIKRVLDSKGNLLEERASPDDPWQDVEQQIDGLYRKLLHPPERVLDERDAYIVNYLLTQVATHGTAARASRLHKPVAGKTGTTNDSFDTWFAGFTPSLVSIVWVGYDTYEYPLSSREQGGRTSLPIWLNFMSKALEGKEETRWKAPEGICEARIDSKTGYRVSDVIPGSFIAPFRCGEEPKTAPIDEGLGLDDGMGGGGL
ncbi:MAG: PBP1A family penicillin-binding protein [Deltaproteobacteria bacterium]|nr:PBP1A family penicillin-binding protein [Deltaproteobacteria bacterium]